ncbi:hypothetical protein FZC66_03885 [Priestia megaterium]|nr:hypothetical protein FZC66_03885 [Priestia megaterium]
MTFLLIVSFLIHGVTLFCIILLYMQLTRVRELEQLQKKVIEEMKQTMNTYLSEVDHQNEEFLLQLQQTSRNKSSNPSKANVEPGQEVQSVPSFDMKSEPTESFAELFNSELAEQNVKASYYSPSEKNSKKEAESMLMTTEDLNELTTDELREISISLQKRGLTIEEIAKHLHRGKTEIELLLKFQQ